MVVVTLVESLTCTQEAVVETVLHALQLQTPMASAPRMSVNNTIFFITMIFLGFMIDDLEVYRCGSLLLVKDGLDEVLVLTSAGDEQASFGVSGFGSAVYADTCASGDLQEDGHECAEPR